MREDRKKKQSTSHRLIAIDRPFTSRQSTNLIIFHERFDESTHYNPLRIKWHFKLLHLYNLFYGYLYHLYCNVFQLCLHLTFYGNGFNASARWKFLHKIMGIDMNLHNTQPSQYAFCYYQNCFHNIILHTFEIRIHIGLWSNILFVCALASTCLSARHRRSCGHLCVRTAIRRFNLEILLV